jgi:hypothetical protein
MTTKISIVGALVLGLVLGRYTLPAKVVTKTETIEKLVTQTNTNTEDHSKTTVTQTKKPDGTVVTTTTTSNDIDTKTTQKSKDDKDTETQKTVSYDTSRIGLNALGLTKPFSSTPTMVYGGQIEYRLIGPIKTGIIGLSDGTVGISIGVQF